MNVRVLVNGRPQAWIAHADRGFRYGDGLFETVLLLSGTAPLWQRHMARLALGCERLGIATPDVTELQRQASQVAADLPRAAVRITVSRGQGTRGYAPQDAVQVTCVVEAAPAPTGRAEDYRDGVRLHGCEIRLASQPRLAGLKHANRLEQVLARSEWSDPEVFEGLMCDADDHAISATAANLFAVLDGVLVTPALDRAGVAGVTRAEVLARRPRAIVRELPRAELLRAKEVFLTSSLRGILPVRAIDTATFAVGPVTRELQSAWSERQWQPEMAP